MPSKIEILVRRPGKLEDVDPFLRVVVAQFVLALLDAEHFELALVPADHKIEPEASVADVVGGHTFLRRDDRVEQRRVHRAEDCHALVDASRPAAQVMVSSVAP